jgi:hypothetical protein
MNKNSTAVHNAHHMKLCEHELKTAKTVYHTYANTRKTLPPPPNFSGNEKENFLSYIWVN